MLLNVAALLLIALVYPVGLYLNDFSLGLLFLSPLASLILIVISIKSNIKISSPFFMLFLAWTFSGLLSAFYLVFDINSFQPKLYLTALSLLGINFGYIFHLLLRNNLVHPKIIEAGLIACAFIFIIKAILGASLSDYLLILNQRFGATANINPNHAAAIFDLALPFCAMNLLISFSRQWWRRLVWGCLYLCLMICTLLTSTRGSLPAIIMTSVYLFTSPVFSTRAKIGISILTTPVFFIFGRLLLFRIQMHSVEDIASSVGRVWMLKSAYLILKKNFFFFGTGVDSFSKIKFHFGFPKWFDSGAFLSSHNLHLEIFLGLGLIALLGRVAFNAILIVNLYKSRKMAMECMPALIALLGFLIHCLFDSLFVLICFMIVVWVFLGYCAFLIDSSSRQSVSFSSGEKND